MGLLGPVRSLLRFLRSLTAHGRHLRASLDDHLFELFVQGKISHEDAIDRAHHPGELQDKIEQFNKGQISAPDDDGLINPDDEQGPQLRKG